MLEFREAVLYPPSPVAFPAVSYVSEEINRPSSSPTSSDPYKVIRKGIVKFGRDALTCRLQERLNGRWSVVGC